MEIIDRTVFEQITVKNPTESDIEELKEKGFQKLDIELYQAKSFSRLVKYEHCKEKEIEV
jgi:hypothetical protein